MIVSFGYEQEMTKVVKAWKSYHARFTGVRWQDEFFEHRIRGHERIDEKSAYILHNPVRAGLVRQEAEWPHRLILEGI